MNPPGLPNATVGGAYFYKLTPQAAHQPSTFSLNVTAGSNAYYVSRTGTIYAAPTAAETATLSVTETGADGTAYPSAFTLVCDNVLRLNGYSRDRSGAQPLASGNVSSKYHLQIQGAAGGSGTGYAYTISAGSLPAGLSMSSAGLISGTPTTQGTSTFTVHVTDSLSNTATAQFSITINAASQVSRPAYNTGTGFFVDGTGVLRDPNGYEFTIRGLDRNHYDSSAWTSGANAMLSGANTVRVFQFWGQTAAYAANQLSPTGGNQYPGLLVMLTANYYSGTNTTGSTSTTLLASILSSWYSAYSTLSPYINRIACNIANEWGPSASTAWQYAYEYVESAISNVSGTTITVNSNAATNPFANCPFAVVKGAGGLADTVVNLSSPGGVQGAWTITSDVSFTGYTSGGSLYGGAVGIMRAAGYTCPLVIDSGGSGQDEADFTSYAAAIQSSDPQKNCIFSYHLYGSTNDRSAPISGISQAAQAVVTLDYPYSSPNIHPFSSSYTGISPNNNTYNGVTSYTLSGVQGMTQINGAQPSSANNVGGVQGSSPWTVTLSVNSTGFGAYTSGGQIVPSTNYTLRLQRLAALGTGSNLCIIVGEFGPGRNIGASATLVSPGQVVLECEQQGLGWIYWAWDDHDQSNGSSSNTWFGCAPWQNSSEAANGAGYWDGKPSALTEQGLDIVMNPDNGLMNLATPASYFL